MYNGTGKYEEAISQFKPSVNPEPNNDDAIRGLASAYASLGRMEEAETTYKLAITARPDYWRGYNSLGSLYFDEGHYAQAAEMFSRVVALAPDSFRGYSNFGGALVLLGRYADAVEALQHSIEIRPTADAYSNLATAYYHLRRFEDAARFSPDTPDVQISPSAMFWYRSEPPSGVHTGSVAFRITLCGEPPRAATSQMS